jgi:hypothetical protein
MLVARDGVVRRRRFEPFWLVVAVLGIHAAPSWASQVPTYDLRELWRIGKANIANYDLDEISAVALDSGGRVYVGQAQERAVRLFDPTGRYVRTIGRAGFGPGELQSVSSLWIGRDNRVIVSDYSRQILVEYTATGEFMRQWDRTHIAGANMVDLRGPLGIVGDSTLVYHDVPSPGTWQEITLQVAKPGETGRVLAVVHAQNPGVSYRSARISVVMSRPIVWGAKWHIYPAGSGILIVDMPPAPMTSTEAYFRLIRIGAAGDTVFSRRFRYTPALVSKILGDSITRERLQRVREIARLSGENEKDLLAVYGEVFSAEMQRPPITDVIISLDNQVWLKEFRTGSDWNSWLVLDSQGRLTHKVRVPGTWKVRAALADHVIATTTDPQNVPQVIKARVLR